MDKIATAKCEIGWIRLIDVKKRACNCGIATILTQLCMIDPFLTQNSDRNKVNIDMGLVGGMTTDESRQMQERLSSTCNGGLIGLKMAARPKAGGFAYISAANTMRFNYMIIRFHRKENKDDPDNPCDETFKNYDVNDGKRLFDGDSGLFDEEQGSGFNARWYFCSSLRFRSIAVRIT